MTLLKATTASASSVKALVIGSGALGLRTAYELLSRGAEVVLESPVPPIDSTVCSAGAGGLWMPFHCEDSSRTLKWSMETLLELYTMASNPRLHSKKLVEIVPAISLQQNHGGPAVQDYIDAPENKPFSETSSSMYPIWTSFDTRLQFQHLTVEMLSWQNQVFRLNIPAEQDLLHAGYKHAWLFHPPIVNAPNMLQYLLDQIKSMNAAVNVHTNQYFQSIQQMQEKAQMLNCNVVVNCTGLGAREICNDENDLIGARGIMHIYDRASCKRRDGITADKDAVILIEEGPFGSDTMPCYLIPRGDVILVGGSYLESDSEQTIREHERQRLIENAAFLGIDTSVSKPIREWVGFRPYRLTARCEIDQETVGTPVTVVHNYGHGGSGWTLNVGAAKECADLVQGER